MTVAMLVTTKIEDTPAGGREMLSKLNRDCLLEIFDTKLFVYQIAQEKTASLMQMWHAMKGHIDGVNHSIQADVIAKITELNVECLYIDGSNFGALVDRIRKALPKIAIVTFFHNVEARFFFGAFRSSRSIRSLGVLFANFVAERKAVTKSDIIIVMTQKDSHDLAKLYGRGADYISPIALEDKFKAYESEAPRAYESEAPRVPSKQRYLLFVGGSFYANRDGIRWFAKNVVPNIGIRTIVVGKGMEKLRAELECFGAIEVVGAVDDLSRWYLESECVIAPIFDGSGMKTKVAEAMMFGKKVVGTPEAFHGYENVMASAGWVCSNTEQFVDCINNLKETKLQIFDSYNRRLYERLYSKSAARARTAAIMSSICGSSAVSVQINDGPS
mgnify:CR=1 FL=1